MFYTNSKEISFRDTNNYKIYGRTVVDEDGLLISWSNSGVGLRFKGERLEVSFASYTAEQPVYVKAFVDGKAQRFCLSGSYLKIVIDCEKDGVHTAKFLRISEANEYLTFKGFKVYGKAPEILEPEKDKKLKLEFMGDSITTGWGVLAPKSQTGFFTYEQDSTKSYAYMTAELLDADIRTEAMGGQGVYRTCGQNEGVQFKKMFDLALREREGYDHSTWTPDVMVLNCGSNDVPGGTTNEKMYDEGNFLLDKIRHVYPEAKIIWVYGMMNSNYIPTLKKLIADKRRAGDKNMYFLPVDLIYSKKDEVGAVGHPNVNASVRVSKKLATLIKRIV